MSQDTLQAEIQAKNDNTYCAFFYGTLMAPGIFYTVCYDRTQVPPEISDRHNFHPAILHGYCRRRVRHADCPGITQAPGRQVFGTFVTGLTESIVVKLDYFEGRKYHRKKVRVKLLTNVGNVNGAGNAEGDERAAEVYIFTEKNDLEDEEWDLEKFSRDRLQQWTQPGYVHGRCDPDVPATVVDES